MSTATLDPKMLEKIQAELGENTKLVGQVNLGVEGLRKHQSEHDSRLKALEDSGRLRKAIMGPQGVADGGAPGHKISVHDLMLHVARQKGARFAGPKWGKAVVQPEWDEKFRADPAAWQREVLDTVAKDETRGARAANMSAGILTEGGAWVPDEWASDIIPALTAKEIVMVAGAGDFQVPAGVGQFHFPREDATSTAYWIGEGSAPTSSGLTAGYVTAQQHKCAVLLKATNDFLRMGLPATEAYIRRAITRDLGLKVDIAALRGTGGANEPLGLNTHSQVTSNAIGTDGGAITYARLRNLVRSVLKQNPPMEKPGFIMHPSVFTEIVKLLDSQNRPLFHSAEFAPGLPGPTPGTIFGYPVYLTTQIPITLTKGASGATLTEIYFGDWSEIVRVLWQELEIRISNQAYDGTDSAYTQDMLFFLAIMPVDWVIKHGKSFAIIPDVTAES